MASRSANEKKYKQWNDKAEGGRIYTRKVNGQQGWYALYIKETDVTENTLSLRQEIYNEKNELVEIHHKYPVDKGHQKLKP